MVGGTCHLVARRPQLDQPAVCGPGRGAHSRHFQKAPHTIGIGELVQTQLCDSDLTVEVLPNKALRGEDLHRVADGVPRDLERSREGPVAQTSAGCNFAT